MWIYTFSLFAILVGARVEFPKTKRIGDQCKLGNDFGECKEISECSLVKKHFKEGGDLFTIFKLYGSEFFCTPDNKLVCCPASERLPEHSTTTTTEGIPTTLKTFTSKRPRRVDFFGSEDKIGKRARDACINYNKNLTLVLVENVINGQDAMPGDFPHMAALGYNIENQIKWDCGGSLISENFVLTAAHCFDVHIPKIVRIGQTNITIKEDGGVDVGIKNYTLHPSYTTKLAYCDIALIELNETIDISKFRPACINTDDTVEAHNNKDFHVTGWGITNTITSERSSILRWARLPSINSTNCKEKIRQNSEKFTYGIIDSQICTFETGKDACNGDSGGPLQKYDENVGNSTIFGVVSIGFGCANQVPGIFTKVSSFTEWIENIVWN